MGVVFDDHIISSPPPNYNESIDSIKSLKILSQNTNSLSLSDFNLNKSNSKFHTKIVSLLKMGCEIVCLQDVRLGSNLKILENFLYLTKYGSYLAYANSSCNSGRGVAILIKKSLSFTVHNIIKSACNNVIMLDSTIQGCRLILGSIYGPKQENCPTFITDIKNKVDSLGLKNFLLLGDFNCITNNFSAKVGDYINNIELLCMRALPNPTHCKKLSDWLSTGSIIDCYRIKHPFREIYSYCPFDKTACNKSRIDLCLSSSNLHNAILDINYPELLSNLYDHRPIIVKLGKNNTKKKKIIDSSLLFIDLIYDFAKIEAYDLVLKHHAVPNKNEMKNILKNINKSTILLSQISSHIKNNQHDIFLETYCNSLKNKLNVLWNSFPSFDDMLGWNSNCEKDTFLFSLLNAILNVSVSHQSNYLKKLNENKKILATKLTTVRTAGCFNSNEAKELESKLLDIENQENMRLLDKCESFSILNLEKPTRAFSQLYKNSKSTVDIGELKNSNNENFVNTEQRNEFIVNHFESILSTEYKSDTSLDSFFGLNTNDPIFEPYKINENDKSLLELPLNLLELDKALESSNLASAPGIDGIPVKALKKFWPLLRLPLLNGFNCMIRKGELLDSMKISLIRLIPKTNKDSYASIKSFRPISLLTSVYKLFSGVIDIRLKLVIDKITHRSQKAYSNTRLIHENLLSIIENMSKSIHTKNNLSLLLIDFSSAFDSLAHDYIYKALEFSNFLPDEHHPVLHSAWQIHSAPSCTQAPQYRSTHLSCFPS